ncbi:MAG: glycosyltransferase family 4 protein [Tannerellaceae bacterium]|jgi:glycosyltransferase involved in cell wall biosynthesis|nr:glycosyltransferase family 4 protein [Tannerellaceae bacterium]
MKIIYDAQIFLQQKAGGISRYHYELFKGMRRRGHDARIAGRFVKNRYLLSDRSGGKSFIPDPTASFALFNRWALQRKLKTAGQDAIFHPANAYDFLLPDLHGLPGARNTVFTIHDMIVEKQNPTLSIGANKWLYARHAGRIIAVSEATKKDIVALWGIAPEKIEVVYHGSSLHLQSARKPAQPLPERFLLYVGDRDGHKNFDTFVRAATGLLKKHPALYLVCAGKRAFSHRERLLLKELGIGKQLLFFLRPDDNVLAYLYAKAQAFVFPSVDEGFGIPILEAWSCGTPVALSCNPCFREVAAEAGYYFDPLSPESICEALETILSDQALRKDLVNKGAARLELFSWEKTVEQTSGLYKTLL